MMTVCKRTLTAILLLICLISLSQAAYAADTGRSHSCNITVQYDDGSGNALSGVSFSIYRVASLNSINVLEKTNRFSGYAVDIDLQDTSSWHTLAGTLESYTQRDHIPPDSEALTGSDGSAAFTGLDPGLYLISGQTTRSNGYTYIPDPLLVYLPYLDENGNTQYSASLSPKKDIRPPSSPDTTPKEQLSVSVLKVWKDSGKESYRPSQISVQLLKDGTVSQTATLNSANNWRYTWTDLDPDSTWTVTEESVPNGYTVSIERNKGEFIVTNSIIPGNPKTPDTKTPADKKLPQTGMLQWPVAVLAAAGILFLTIGISIRKNS